MLGEITWILTQSRLHRAFAIGDLEWMVMPPILINQFRVFHGEKAPIGFALWAFLSDEAEARMCAQVDAGMGARLRADDWKSGDALWLVELVVLGDTPDNKLAQTMLADLMKSAFAGRKVKFHVADPNTGARVVRELGA